MIPTDLARDQTTGDLVLGSGDLTLTAGPAAVAQSCEQTCRFFRGEWYADEAVGIPYLTEILGKKNPSLPTIRETFRKALAGTPGVAAVDRATVTLDPRTRAAAVAWSVTAEGGATVTGTTQAGA